MTHILEEKEKFMVGDIVSFKDEKPEGVSDERLVISEIRRMNTDDVIILLRCEDNRTIATDPGNIRKEGHMEERSEPLGDIAKGCTVRVNSDSGYNDKIKNKDLKVEKMYWTDDIVVRSEDGMEVLVNAEDVYIPYNEAKGKEGCDVKEPLKPGDVVAVKDDVTLIKNLGEDRDISGKRMTILEKYNVKAGNTKTGYKEDVFYICKDEDGEIFDIRSEIMEKISDFNAPKDVSDKEDDVEYDYSKYKACIFAGLKQQEYAEKAIRSMEKGWLFTVKEGVISSISEHRRVYVRNMKFVVEAVFKGNNDVKHLIVRGKDGNLYGINEKNDVRIKELSVYQPLNEEVISSKSKVIPKEKIEEANDCIFRERPSENSKGKKNDFLDDKLRWDLLPMAEIEDIVKVYHAGSKKYGDNNWQNLENGFERYRAALMRHLMEYMKGERVDADTGSWHLAQVCWNAIAMLWLDKHDKGLYPIDLMPGK